MKQSKYKHYDYWIRKIEKEENL